MKFLFQKPLDIPSLTCLETFSWWNEDPVGDTLVSVDEYSPGVIPIGTVEFVEQFMERPPLPMNVPLELERFAGREFQTTPEQKSFLKSRTKIKHPLNGIWDPAADYAEGPDWSDWQISKFIDIVNEYRVFVFNGRIEGVHLYSGDLFDGIPNRDVLKRIINAKVNAPPAWTLDVGLTHDKETVIIEAHHFYSVGLYGFAGLNLPFMYSQWWHWLERRSSR